MARCLNTSATNYYLEELIKAAWERLIRISGEVRLSAETVVTAEDSFQADTDADQVEDKPYDKLTTLKLAKVRGMRTAELTDKFITAGLLTKDGDQLKLRYPPKSAGGEFRFSKQFGPFVIRTNDSAMQ